MTAPTFEKCIFLNNTAYTYGGAVYAEIYAAPSFHECTFAGNVANLNGGGIFAFAGCILEMNSCTFYGNRAGEGGALYVSDHCYLKFNNTIIAFGEQGAAVFCDETCEPYLSCCDIYGNAGGDWIGAIADQYGVSGNFSADPLFCNTPLENFRLDSRSPCLPEQNPECGQVGAWGPGCVFSDVPVGGSVTALRFTGVPNPFVRGEAVRYTVGSSLSSSLIQLGVYDLAGRRVRILVDTPQTPGDHSVVWDGCDASGTPVRGGVYFYSLTQGMDRTAQQVVLVR